MNPFERRFSMSAEERESKIQQLLQRNPEMTREQAELRVDNKILEANESLKELKEREQSPYKAQGPAAETDNKQEKHPDLGA